MPEPVLAIDDLEASYTPGSPPVIGPISLAVQPGEFLTIVGASGCGKTTLLNCIGGHLRPQRGVIRIGGQPVVSPPAQVGTVFQRPNLFPWLDVLDNVVFGLRMRRVPKRERIERGLEMLALVRLDRFAHARPYELSGGMQQRVAIARSLAIRPQLLLMDEPLGSLDAITRDRMQLEIERLWKQTQTTILLITHSIDEAVTLGQRVAVLGGSPGRIRGIFDTAYIETKDPGVDMAQATAFLEVRARILAEIEPLTSPMGDEHGG